MRHSIELVTARDLADLLPLMRAYCDFYEAAPSDDALLGVSRALLADPDRAGGQLIARDERSSASGFATLFWTWDTLEGCAIAVMNDLYVVPEARGGGLGDRLIDACVERCRARGLTRMDWQTAPENARAQRIYDRRGARREAAVVYELALRSASLPG